MSFWIAVSIVVALAIALAALIAYERWITPGVNILRNLFEDKKISSVYTLSGVKWDGRKYHELRLRRHDAAEFYYPDRWCRKPFSDSTDQKWAEDLAKKLSGYAGWQVAFFAHRLAKERGAVLYKTTVDGNGANGWTLTFH